MTMHQFWTQNGPFAPNKVFMENYYYHFHLPISPFHSANFFKKNLKSWFRVMRMCAIFRPKMAHLSWTNIFGKNHCYYFHLPIGPFHCAKFKNILTADLALWRCTNFWTQNGPFAPSKAFLENYYYHFYLPISPFHCAKFKKNSSSRSRVMRMCIFWAQNYPFPPIFSENLLMSLVSFIHAYLHDKNQSQILVY